MTASRFFVFEGVHGAGKSTLVSACADTLRTAGYSVKTFSFPDKSTDLGKSIRSLITDPRVIHEWRIVGSLYAGFANRFHTCLDDGQSVWLCDRHSVTSGLIFQDDIPDTIREELYGPSLAALRREGQIIFCDCDDTIARQRSSQRNSQLRDGDDFDHNKARDAFFSQHDECTKKMKQMFVPACQAWGLSLRRIDSSVALTDVRDTVCSFILSHMPMY